jgi:iron-sulfur cluster assembly protein
MSYLKITDKAADELKRRNDMGEGAIGIRLSVTNTGCSGHQYKMEHVFEESAEDDKTVAGDTALYTPKSQLMMLLGVVVDFEEGKFGSNFTFNNPNADNACGCGESFQIKPADPDELRR